MAVQALATTRTLNAKNVSYLKIIRPINLLLIVLMLGLFKYGFLSRLNIQLAMGDFEFLLLAFATVCIAAGGYVINDSYDVGIDTVNKPKKVLIGRKISQKSASNYYIILTSVGVGTGFYLANLLEHPGFAIVFILVAALLYLYASYLKSMLLVGNVIISILVALTPLLLVFFDIVPAMNSDRMNLQVIASGVLLHYAVFAFAINFIREIVKDLQDMKGDKSGGRNTVPIALGRERTVLVVFVLGVLSVIGLVIYMYTHLYDNQIMVLYFLLALLAPLLYFCIKSWQATTPRDYSLLSNLLKVILFLGVCSIVLYPNVILPYYEI